MIWQKVKDLLLTNIGTIDDDAVLVIGGILYFIFGMSVFVIGLVLFF